MFEKNEAMVTPCSCGDTEDEVLAQIENTLPKPKGKASAL